MLPAEGEEPFPLPALEVHKVKHNLDGFPATAKENTSAPTSQPASALPVSPPARPGYG